MGFINYLIAPALAILFVVAMFSGVAQFHNDNSFGNNNISENEFFKEFNTNINSEANSYKQDANTGKDALEGDVAEGGSDTFGLTSIVGVGISFFNNALATVQLLLNTSSEVLGIPVIVINMIFAGLIIVGIVLFWRVIRVGGT